MRVLTWVIRFVAVRIVRIEGSGSFRLCTGERRYLDARHHYQYPQHTDERLLADFTLEPSSDVVRVSFGAHVVSCRQTIGLQSGLRGER